MGVIFSDKVLYQVCRILDGKFGGSDWPVTIRIYRDEDKNYAEFLEESPKIRAIYKKGGVKWKFNEGEKKLLFYVSNSNFDIEHIGTSYPNQEVSNKDLGVAYLYYMAGGFGSERLLSACFTDLRQGVFSNIEDAIKKHFGFDRDMKSNLERARKEIKYYVGKPYGVKCSGLVEKFVSSEFKLSGVVPIFCIDFYGGSYGYISDGGIYNKAGYFENLGGLFLSISKCVRSDLSLSVYYFCYNNKEY